MWYTLPERPGWLPEILCGVWCFMPAMQEHMPPGAQQVMVGKQRGPACIQA